MACGKWIYADLCQAIVNLLQSHKYQDVAEMAGVSLSSMYQIASEMARSRGFPPQKRCPKGQFQALTEPQTQVSHHIYSWPSANWIKYIIGHIQQSPDIYLEELSDEIMELTGDGVSVSPLLGLCCGQFRGHNSIYWGSNDKSIIYFLIWFLYSSWIIFRIQVEG